MRPFRFLPRFSTFLAWWFVAIVIGACSSAGATLLTASGPPSHIPSAPTTTDNIPDLARPHSISSVFRNRVPNPVSGLQGQCAEQDCEHAPPPDGSQLYQPHSLDATLWGHVAAHLPTGDDLALSAASPLLRLAGSDCEDREVLRENDHYQVNVQTCLLAIFRSVLWTGFTENDQPSGNGVYGVPVTGENAFALQIGDGAHEAWNERSWLQRVEPAREALRKLKDAVGLAGIRRDRTHAGVAADLTRANSCASFIGRVRRSLVKMVWQRMHSCADNYRAFPTVQYRGVVLLGVIGGPEAVQLLRLLLEEPDVAFSRPVEDMFAELGLEVDGCPEAEEGVRTDTEESGEDSQPQQGDAPAFIFIPPPRPVDLSPRRQDAPFGPPPPRARSLKVLFESQVLLSTLRGAVMLGLRLARAEDLLIELAGASYSCPDQAAGNPGNTIVEHFRSESSDARTAPPPYQSGSPEDSLAHLQPARIGVASAHTDSTNDSAYTFVGHSVGSRAAAAPPLHNNKLTCNIASCCRFCHVRARELKWYAVWQLGTMAEEGNERTEQVVRETLARWLKPVECPDGEGGENLPGRTISSASGSSMLEAQRRADHVDREQVVGFADQTHNLLLRHIAAKSLEEGDSMSRTALVNMGGNNFLLRAASLERREEQIGW